MSSLHPFLDQLRSILPPSKVIQEYLDITRKGHEYQGLCPFHHEKTPSFTINDQKSFYHCFGCGAHGDIITFVMEKTGLSFIDTVKQLASKAGLTLPEDHQPKESHPHTTHIFKALSEAKDWFVNQLWQGSNPSVRQYIKERGIAKDTAFAFHLGYAPPNKEALKTHLNEKGFSNTILQESGIINEKGAVRFFNRLIFPIFDLKNRVIGFGGRGLDSDQIPKYLNSPESTVFHKKEVLYGLNFSYQPHFDKSDPFIIVEGYMDALSLLKNNFRAVATMGTSLSEQHFNLLWRSCPKPILCFDGDAAGKRAALRAINIALPFLDNDKSLQICFLPDSMDPDDFIKRQGKEAFQKLLSESMELVDVIWSHVLLPMPHYTPEQKAKVKATISSIQSKMSHKVIAQFYYQDLLNRFNTLVSPPYQKRSYKNTPHQNHSPVIIKKPPQQTLIIEKALLLALINNSGIVHDIIEEIGSIHFSSPEYQDLAGNILLWAHESHHDNLRDFLLKKSGAPLLNEIDGTYVYGYAPFCRVSLDMEPVKEQWLELFHFYVEKVHTKAL